MYYIPVILGSIRRNRESAKVAKYVVELLAKRSGISTELIDLKAFDLPMMEERLRFRDDAPAAVHEFSSKMNRADAIVIVTPEYNSGYPGVLKNALDYLKDEYRLKAFGIVTVSSAWSGGMLCLAALRQVILHLGGVPVPAILAIAQAQESFDNHGNPLDPTFTRRANRYVDDVLWLAEALTVQRQKHGCKGAKQ